MIQLTEWVLYKFTDMEMPTTLTGEAGSTIKVYEEFGASWSIEISGRKSSRSLPFAKIKAPRVYNFPNQKSN